MNTFEIVIVGYGNVGRGVHRAIESHPDTRLAGILTRDPSRVKQQLEDRSEDLPPIENASETLDFARAFPGDVAILCGGTKEDLPVQGPRFASHYNTVDSFDHHDDLPDYFADVDQVARNEDHLCVVGAGWDPGTFSRQRVLADAFSPGADIHTVWGPGVSQGHSDAARRVPGVRDARQYTEPREDAKEQLREGEPGELEKSDLHRRVVYVVPEEGADHDRIEQTIRNMPYWFEDYDTEVHFIDQRQMDREHSGYPHGGSVLSQSTMGDQQKAEIDYTCRWDSNPAATASILVAHARAAHRMHQRGETGARTTLDIRPADLSFRSREELLRDYV